jgi:hypothetical protein
VAHQIENLHSAASPQPNEKMSHTEFTAQHSRNQSEQPMMKTNLK